MYNIKNSALAVSALFFVATVFAQNPLIVPAALTGTTFNLSIQEGSMEFVPGVTTSTMGVSGPILGPTLIFEQGEDVDVYFDNQLSDTTTIHWHGMHVPAEFDGGPHTPIAPGTVWNPHFTVLDHASTMWYHPHLMHKTNEHVQKGIAGFVIVKDAEEAALNLPRTYGVDDIPVVFQTKTIDALGQIDINMDHAGMDTLLLTNATVDAYFDAPAQMIRLRLLNGASERSFNIGLSDNANFQVIASDGGLLQAPVSMNRLLISPGERYEIIVDLNNMEGSSIQVMNYGSTIPSGIYGTAVLTGMGGVGPIPFYADNHLNGLDFPLLTLNVGAPNFEAITTIPAVLASNTSWDVSIIDNTRSVLMTPQGAMGDLNGPFQFNGAPFNIDVVNEVIPLNNTEVWTLTNQTMIAHPFHIHDVQFNIQEINGGIPPIHMQGWKDVVLVSAQMGTVKFITKFADYANPDVPYMYHCHILTHEERGMMGQFTVVDDSGVTEMVENDAFHLYPNPVSSVLNIKRDNIDLTTISIFDSSGRIVLTEKISGASLSIDLHSLIAGVYIVKIGTDVSRFNKY